MISSGGQRVVIKHLVGRYSTAEHTDLRDAAPAVQTAGYKGAKPACAGSPLPADCWVCRGCGGSRRRATWRW